MNQLRDFINSSIKVISVTVQQLFNDGESLLFWKSDVVKPIEIKANRRNTLSGETRSVIIAGN
jgi:hypothetical protein